MGRARRSRPIDLRNGGDRPPAGAGPGVPGSRDVQWRRSTPRYCSPSCRPSVSEFRIVASSWKSRRRRRCFMTNGVKRRSARILERVVLAAAADGWVRLSRSRRPHGPPAQSTRGTARSSPRHCPHSRRLPPPQTTVRRPDQAELDDPLSERELEILTLLAQRDGNKEIAARLFIAPGTVKRHPHNIYRKLHVNDRRQAVARAAQLGLFAEPIAPPSGNGCCRMHHSARDPLGNSSRRHGAESECVLWCLLRRCRRST